MSSFSCPAWACCTDDIIDNKHPVATRTSQTASPSSTLPYPKALNSTARTNPETDVKIPTFSTTNNTTAGSSHTLGQLTPTTTEEAAPSTPTGSNDNANGDSSNSGKSTHDRLKNSPSSYNDDSGSSSQQPRLKNSSKQRRRRDVLKRTFLGSGSSSSNTVALTASTINNSNSSSQMLQSASTYSGSFPTTAGHTPYSFEDSAVASSTAGFRSVSGRLATPAVGLTKSSVPFRPGRLELSLDDSDEDKEDGVEENLDLNSRNHGGLQTHKVDEDRGFASEKPSEIAASIPLENLPLLSPASDSKIRTEPGFADQDGTPKPYGRAPPRTRAVDGPVIYATAAATEPTTASTTTNTINSSGNYITSAPPSSSGSRPASAARMVAVRPPFPMKHLGASPNSRTDGSCAKNPGSEKCPFVYSDKADKCVSERVGNGAEDLSTHGSRDNGSNGSRKDQKRSSSSSSSSLSEASMKYRRFKHVEAATAWKDLQIQQQFTLSRSRTRAVRDVTGKQDLGKFDDSASYKGTGRVIMSGRSRHKKSHTLDDLFLGFTRSYEVLPRPEEIQGEAIEVEDSSWYGDESPVIISTTGSTAANSEMMAPRPVTKRDEEEDVMGDSQSEDVDGSSGSEVESVETTIGEDPGSAEYVMGPSFGPRKRRRRPPSAESASTVSTSSSLKFFQNKQGVVGEPVLTSEQMQEHYEDLRAHRHQEVVESFKAHFTNNDTATAYRQKRADETTTQYMLYLLNHFGIDLDRLAQAPAEAAPDGVPLRLLKNHEDWLDNEDEGKPRGRKKRGAHGKNSLQSEELRALVGEYKKVQREMAAKEAEEKKNSNGKSEGNELQQEELQTRRTTMVAVRRWMTVVMRGRGPRSLRKATAAADESQDGSMAKVYKEGRVASYQEIRAALDNTERPGHGILETWEFASERTEQESKKKEGEEDEQVKKTTLKKVIRRTISKLSLRSRPQSSASAMVMRIEEIVDSPEKSPTRPKTGGTISELSPRDIPSGEMTTSAITASFYTKDTPAATSSQDVSVALSELPRRKLSYWSEVLDQEEGGSVEVVPESSKLKKVESDSTIAVPAVQEPEEELFILDNGDYFPEVRTNFGNYAYDDDEEEEEDDEEGYENEELEEEEVVEQDEISKQDEDEQILELNLDGAFSKSTSPIIQRAVSSGEIGSPRAKWEAYVRLDDEQDGGYEPDKVHQSGGSATFVSITERPTTAASRPQSHRHNGNTMKKNETNESAHRRAGSVSLHELDIVVKDDGVDEELPRKEADKIQKWKKRHSDKIPEENEPPKEVSSHQHESSSRGKSRHHHHESTKHGHHKRSTRDKEDKLKKKNSIRSIMSLGRHRRETKAEREKREQEEDADLARRRRAVAKKRAARRAAAAAAAAAEEAEMGATVEMRGEQAGGGRREFEEKKQAVVFHYGGEEEDAEALLQAQKEQVEESMRRKQERKRREKQQREYRLKQQQQLQLQRQEQLRQGRERQTREYFANF